VLADLIPASVAPHLVKQGPQEVFGQVHLAEEADPEDEKADDANAHDRVEARPRIPVLLAVAKVVAHHDSGFPVWGATARCRVRKNLVRGYVGRGVRAAEEKK
jgi:hypothetical protein